VESTATAKAAPTARPAEARVSSLAERLRVTTLRQSAESAGAARLPETLAATAATQPVLAARRAAAELAGASSTERLPSGIGPAAEGLSKARIG
jgi:phosphoribosylcarboxyaminoimidazole (NCAIR) mutase